VILLKAILWICTFPVSLLFWPLGTFRRRDQGVVGVHRISKHIEGYGLPGDTIHYSSTGPVIAKHIKLSDALEAAWKKGDRKKIIKAAQAHIAIAPKVLLITMEEDHLNGHDWIPEHNGYTRLAMLYEREKNYDSAISTCRDAIAAGWNPSSYQHRLERCEKKMTKRM